MAAPESCLAVLVLTPPTMAAAGQERHPDQAAKLHAYWVTGPGLAKWAKSPHPWQALHNELGTTDAGHGEIPATATNGPRSAFRVSWAGDDHTR